MGLPTVSPHHVGIPLSRVEKPPSSTQAGTKKTSYRINQNVFIVRLPATQSATSATMSASVFGRFMLKSICLIRACFHIHEGGPGQCSYRTLLSKAEDVVHGNDPLKGTCGWDGSNWHIAVLFSVWPGYVSRAGSLADAGGTCQQRPHSPLPAREPTDQPPST